jgi:glycosyltransferase involved in cell wall biosynthesis
VARPLTVGLDVSALALTKAGTARYVRGLLETLPAVGEVTLRPLAFGSPGRVSTVMRDVGWYPVALPRAARRHAVDVLHCTTFRAPVTNGGPALVTTFHDLAVLRLPHCFNGWSRFYAHRTLRRVARAASALIAVSDFTRRELVELLGARDDHIHVVPNGVGPPFTAEGPAASGDYVLAVSTLEPRKNLVRLAQAFELARLSDCELRVVGSRGWGHVDLTGTSARRLGEVTDDELAALYRGARCVAYVSLYEGFGLPLLEAMACGAPVVTSTAEALGELGGDAVVTVDPLDPEAIADGLEQAIRRREELRARGLERARQFTWQQTAERTAAVYQAVAA